MTLRDLICLRGLTWPYLGVVLAGANIVGMEPTGKDGDEPDEASVTALEYLANFPLNPRTFELSKYVVNAREGVLQLRACLGVLLTALEEREAKSPAQIADEHWVARHLDDATRTRIRADVDAYFLEIETDVETVEFDESAIEGMTEEEAMADPFSAIWSITDFGAYFQKNFEWMLHLVTASHEEQLYWWEYVMARERGSQLQLLLRTQYTVAIGLIQPTVAQLLLLVMRAEQDAVGDQMSRSQLDEAVSRQLLRGPDSWREQLRDRFNVSLLDRAIEWDVLSRAWEQRNLFVHRGGLIDSRFRDRFPDAPVVGTFIELTAEDVYDAFDLAAGVRLAFLLAAADRVAPGSAEHFASSYSDIVLEDLDKQRWRLVETTALVAEAFVGNRVDAAIARAKFLDRTRSSARSSGDSRRRHRMGHLRSLSALPASPDGLVAA